ncbi:Signal peptidase I [hydrothermal vent metagenome]|uniref:Signal peptidase I n=1 Tax=hydrothermal vent metagenome TaxID=652676 RepID=A0A3B0ZDW5_9ZZZZ
MNVDFSAIIVIATFLTGMIWAYDSLVLAPKRKTANAEVINTKDDVEIAAPKEPLIVEYSKAFFPVILAVLLLRSFLVEPFRIPSGSMMPTLLTGDFILVNKFTYGIRLPVLDTKIMGVGEPERGDVAVFRFPQNPSIDYIKRVVGLPGDRISYRNKILYVNDKPMPLTDLGSYQGKGTALAMTGAQWAEEQLGDVKHQILMRSESPPRNGEFRVPAGHYFVMGDSRDNSNDSRFWGTVPEENLVGKAFMIWMNWDKVDNTVRFSRIGNSID